MSDNYELLGLAASCAFDSIGWHPASVAGVPRSEFKSGVNEGQTMLQDLIYKFQNEFEKQLSDEIVRKKMMELVSEGYVFVMDRSVGEDVKIAYSLNMNDTFAYACADCEDFELTDLDLIFDLYKKYSHHGVTAWAAVKRDDTPIKPRATKEYYDALTYIRSKTDVD